MVESVFAVTECPVTESECLSKSPNKQETPSMVTEVGFGGVPAGAGRSLVAKVRCLFTTRQRQNHLKHHLDLVPRHLEPMLVRVTRRPRE
jgi:hypothetical protein